MSTRTTRLDHAVATALEARIAIGREIRLARHSAGLSLRRAGAAVRMSHSRLGRIERGVPVNVTLEQLARACAAVGLRPVLGPTPTAIQ